MCFEVIRVIEEIFQQNLDLSLENRVHRHMITGIEDLRRQSSQSSEVIAISNETREVF